MTEGVEKPNQEKLRTFEEKEAYIFLGMWEAVTIKQREMKEKKIKEYIRRTKKLLEVKLYCRNLVQGTNTRAIHLVRYSEPFLK